MDWVTWVVTAVLAAAAFSGRLSMHAARFWAWVAWCFAVYGTWSERFVMALNPQQRIAVTTLAGFVFAYFVTHYTNWLEKPSVGGEEYKKQTIRRKLSSRLPLARELQKKCRDKTVRDERLNRDINKWAEMVEKDLKRYLDDSYIELFRDPSGHNLLLTSAFSGMSDLRIRYWHTVEVLSINLRKIIESI